MKRSRMPGRNRKRQKRREEAGEVYGPYFRWMSGKPCEAANGNCITWAPTVGHHVRSVGAGGVDAENLAPLCILHHREAHDGNLGHIDLKRAAAVWWSRYCEENETW